MDVILDFDGTLVTDCGYSLSWLVELARSHGYRGNEEDARLVLHGCTDFDIALRLRLKDRRDEFTAELLRENRRSLHHARWDPDLRPILEGLADRHVLHVLSNRDQQSLEEGLLRLECRHLFDQCVGSAPGIDGKPASQLFRRLCSKAPVSPESAVYVGDKAIDREFSARIGIAFLAACWYRDSPRGTKSRAAICETFPGRSAWWPLSGSRQRRPQTELSQERVRLAADPLPRVVSRLSPAADAHS